MKTLDLITSANRNLLRNKTRSFLTILAIFVGSFTIILSSAINAGVNDFIDKQVASIGGDGFIEVMPAAATEQMMQMMASGEKVTEYNDKTGSVASASISNEDFEAMKKVDGVKSLEVYHMLGTEWMRLKGAEKKYNVSVEYFPAGTMNVDLSAGRMTDDNASEYEIIINEDWLKPFGLSSAEDALGKTVEIAAKQTVKCYVTPSDCTAIVEAKIVGVQAPGVLTMDGDLHINKALDQKLYNLQNEGISEESLEIYFAVGDVDPDKIDDIREAFKNIGSGYSFITVDDTVGMIRTFFDVILAVFNIFGVIALIAAAIGIINTLFMSVQERTREIGLDKSLGMSRIKIFLSFSIEAISLGFWGSIFGIIISMVIGFGANSVLHSAGGFLEPFPTFNLVKFTPEIIIPIVLLVMFIAFLAGTAPALKAAKKNPIDALRYE
ncbi:MAG: ABC transporter permease [Candidatus Saccharibacteria bacterium]|nr:ABC transporter permease [Candidatus Saccharibacteria bacterium]